MRDLNDLEGSKAITDKGLEIMNYIFTRSQENLNRPMPWGDKEHPNGSGKNPSVITDTGGILVSAIPPYVQDGKLIIFEYPAPHSWWVEYGTPPHPVAASQLIGWVNRKLQLHGNEALRVAYAIAAKIKKEGMPAHPFVRPAIDDGKTHYGLVAKA